MDKLNKFKLWVFIIFLLVFVFGGYILMKNSYVSNEDNNIKEIKKEAKIKDIRIDASKDYIYFSDVDSIENELDIDYMNININFNDSSNLADVLNNETREMKESLKYDDEIEDGSYNNLSYAKYKKYITYMYDNYLSLVVNYYIFDRDNLVSFIKCDTYIFDVTTGKVLTEDDILLKFNKQKSEIEKAIQNYLEGQHLLDEEKSIDIESTLEVNDTYNYFIDKIGRLSVSIIVKSEQKDYNDIVIID